MHFKKLGLISGSACLALASCSPLGDESVGSPDDMDGSAAAPATGGSPGSGGATQGSGASAGGGLPATGGSFGVGGSGAADPDGGGVDACVTAQAVAQPVPAALQLVVDTSGSMTWGVDGSQTPLAGQSKWDITKAALENTAGALPASTALGLGFYPNTDLDVPCFVEQMALPIASLGELGSAHRQQLSTVLAGVVPQGGTPTHSAYRFGLSQLRAANQPGNAFLVLITDGVPTFTAECVGDGHAAVDSSPIVAEAAAASAAGIRTFVIGSPGSEPARAALSRISSAGGTAPAGCSEQGPTYCHFDMTTEPNLASALTAALASIVDQVLSCEYPVPAPPAGQTLDRSRVNVVYTSAGGAPETIPRDPSASECNTGWQYTADGARVLLCGATCERIKHGGSVQLEFGCETKIAPVE